MENSKGISYFQNKTWSENISRTELLFCAELFFLLKKQENLLKFIEKFKLEPGDYDVGYEVSFYRDLSKEYAGKIKGKYSPKRTFDLALFSENDIYIIEAKAQQRFKSQQLGFFKDDKKKIPEMLAEINHKTKIKIHFLALISNNDKHETIGIFEKTITWDEIYELYGKEIFKRANEIYGK